MGNFKWSGIILCDSAKMDFCYCELKLFANTILFREMKDHE